MVFTIKQVKMFQPDAKMHETGFSIYKKHQEIFLSVNQGKFMKKCHLFNNEVGQVCRTE